MVAAEKKEKAEKLLASLKEKEDNLEQGKQKRRGKQKKRGKEKKESSEEEEEEEEEEEKEEEEEEEEEEKEEEEEEEKEEEEVLELLDRRVVDLDRSTMRVEYKVRTVSGDSWRNFEDMIASQNMFDDFHKAQKKEKKFEAQCMRLGWYDYDTDGTSYIITSVHNRRTVGGGRDAQSHVVFAGKAPGGKVDHKPEWIKDTEAMKLRGWLDSIAAYQLTISNKARKAPRKTIGGNWSYATD